MSFKRFFLRINFLLIGKQNLPMTEVTNKLNIDQSTLTQLVQITDKMRVDLQQVNGRMNVLEQKVNNWGGGGMKKQFVFNFHFSTIFLFYLGMKCLEEVLKLKSTD